jgi:hypothetical protein
MQYYSAIKKNESMLFSRKWMELEMIILSEISQVQKDKYHAFAYIQNLELTVIIRHDWKKETIWGKPTGGGEKGDGG